MFPEPVTSRTGIITKQLTPAEYPWLDRVLHKGTAVFEFVGETFGCVTPEGTAVALEPNSYPFVEVPTGSVIFD